MNPTLNTVSHSKKLKNTQRKPAFAVLIPCYNDFDGLIHSLNSLVSAQFFEIIIVDDGSKLPLDEKTVLELTSPSLSISILRNTTNQGVAASLNRGIEFILKNFDVPYIARLDCGDTCHPARFDKQLTYLNAHPEISILGTHCHFADESGAVRFSVSYPENHSKIVTEMKRRCAFIHPTVMMRTSVFKKLDGYPENYPHAEDYALFAKILETEKGANLPEFLTQVAYRPQGVSGGNRKAQLFSRTRIIARYYGRSIGGMMGIVRTLMLMFLPTIWIDQAKKSMKK